MKIQIIGARALNPIASTIVKKHASARIYSGSKCVQIDVGNPWQGKADYLLISHLHLDHAGKINTVPKSTTVYLPHKSLKDHLETAISGKVELLRSQKPTQIGPFSITAFPVHHSKYTKTFGFHIRAEKKVIVWLSDFRNLRGCAKYFRNADIIFIGASTFNIHISHGKTQNYGHMAIVKTLSIFQQQKIQPKKIFLVHLGRRLTPLAQKLKKLQQMYPEFDISAAIDGMKIKL